MYPQNQQYQQQYSPEVTNLFQQPMQYPVDQPPFVPQVTCSNPAVYPFSRTIAGCLVNEFNTKATLNPARRVAFNLAIQNGYQNETFVKAFDLAMDLFDLNMTTNRTPSPEAGIGDAVVRAALYVTVYIFMQSRFANELRSMCDHATVMEFQNTAQLYSQDENNIARMKASRGMAPTGMGMNNPQGYPTPYQQGYPQQQGYPMQNGVMGGSPAYSSPTQNYPNSGGSVFTTGPSFQSNQPDTNSLAASRYATGSAPTYNKTPVNSNTSKPPEQDFRVEVKRYPQQVMQPQQVSQPQQVTPVVEDEWDAVTKWVPSEEFPLPPVVDPRTEKLVSKTYQVHDPVTGTRQVTEVFIIKRSKEEMDRDTHTISTISQTVTAFVPPNFTTREQFVNAALTSKVVTNLDTKPFTTDETDNAVNTMENVVMHGDWKLVENLPYAILATKVGLKSQSVETNASFRTYSLVVKSFVSRKSQQHVLLKLSNATNFSDLALRMQSFLTSEHDSETHQFIQDFDRYLCTELTSYMNGKFACDLKSIGCFMEDYKDLGQFLTNAHSSNAAEALRKNEPKIVSALVRPVVDEGVRADISCGVDDVHLTSVENAYTITCLNVQSEELNLKLFKTDSGNSNLLRQSVNPALYRFVSELFKQAENEMESSFAHHLIVTNDEKIYEVHRALIGYEENFLISNFSL